MSTLAFKRNGTIDLTKGRKTLKKNLGNIPGATGQAMFLGQALNTSVSLEDGITAFEILQCLSPWSFSIGLATNTDLAAWIEAARKTKSRDTSSKLSHILLQEFMTFDSMTRGRSFTFSKTGIVPYKRKKTNKVEIGHSWSAVAITKKPFRTPGIKEPQTEVGLSLTPLKQWVHLPIKIDLDIHASETVIDGDFTSRAPLFDRASGILINPRDILMEDGKSYMRTSRISFARRQSPCFVDVIINGFIGDLLAHSHPDDIGTEREKVVATLHEVKTKGVRKVKSTAKRKN